MKYTKIKKLLLICLVPIILFGCTSTKVLVKFSAGNNELVLTKTEIKSVQIEEDASNKKYVRMLLTESGQQKISEFTGNNINQKLSISSKNKVLMENIPIRDKITMNDITFSFKNSAEAEDFAKKMEKEL